MTNHDVSTEPGRRRAERQAGRAARDAARARAASWPELWSESWVDDVVRAGLLRGLDRDDAVALVDEVRALLDHLAPADATQAPALASARQAPPGQVTPGQVQHGRIGQGQARPRRRGRRRPELARTELAAQLFGSSHALDTGTRLEAAAGRALAYREWSRREDGARDSDRGGGDVWERAGVHPDLTSAPALTWALPAEGPVGDLVEAARALRAPVHLSRFLLREQPVRVPAGAPVLVVENPRLVEAAAQTGVPCAVVTTHGNPAGTVRLLLEQLLASDARLAYHGDFDAAGLGICGRMAQSGLVPWRMDADDYLAAVRGAEAEGVELPRDTRPSPPTPWDPELAAAFDVAGRRVVHEERLLPGLLRDISW